MAMSLKDILDLIVAIGTLLAAVFAGASALIAARAVRDAASVINLQREAIRAQSFIDTIGYEREIGFSQGMDTIRGLSNEECVNYDEFQKRQPGKDDRIRKVVDFLNHLAHLVRHGYVTPQHILILYTPSIEACRNKLLGEGKWLQGFGKNAHSPKYYLNFECLCNNLENLWYGKEVQWPDPRFQALEELRR